MPTAAALFTSLVCQVSHFLSFNSLIPRLSDQAEEEVEQEPEYKANDINRTGNAMAMNSQAECPVTKQLAVMPMCSSDC